MSSVKINGKKGVFEQPIKYGLSDSGPYSIRTFHGTRQEIQALIPGLAFSASTYEVRDTFSGSKVELEVRSSLPPQGSPEVPINSWEFFAQEIEKDILEADNALVNAVSDDQKAAVRAALQDPSNDALVTDITDPSATILYIMMLQGVKTARVLQPLVRHTATVSNAYTVPAALTNVGKILTTAQLGTLENFPSGLLFNLPSGISSRTGLAYGWYKKFPTVRGAANQKIQIEQEWEYGLWPKAPDFIEIYPWA
jgi:hypothetical protein